MKLLCFKHVTMYQNSQKNVLNQRIFHNLQSHLACWYTIICTFIRYTVCESLVDIQQFRYEWLSIMYMFGTYLAKQNNLSSQRLVNRATALNYFALREFSHRSSADSLCTDQSFVHQLNFLNIINCNYFLSLSYQYEIL